MFDFITVAKALTDENRVRILMALRRREMCVCQITGLLDLSTSTTSKHLSILRQARLIDSRKRGKWVYYREAEFGEGADLPREALAFVHGSLDADPVILEDERRIEEITAREQALLSGDECSPEIYHSLEIHSLAQDEV